VHIVHPSANILDSAPTVPQSDYGRPFLLVSSGKVVGAFSIPPVQSGSDTLEQGATYGGPGLDDSKAIIIYT
jgi:hypothetical protein